MLIHKQENTSYPTEPQGKNGGTLVIDDKKSFRLFWGKNKNKQLLRKKRFKIVFKNLKLVK